MVKAESIKRCNDYFDRCEECEVSFSSEHALRQHKNYECEVRKDTPTQKHKSRYTCPGCLTIFTKKGDLQKHMLKCGVVGNKEQKTSHSWIKTEKLSHNVNDIARNSKCLMCSKWFSRKELEKHLWSCRVKRPCLNRIVEIKDEFNDKSCDQNV